MLRSTKYRTIERAFALLCLMGVLSVIFMSFGLTVFAAPDLNDVTGQTSRLTQAEQSGTDSKSIADGLSQAWGDLAVDNDDVASAASFTSPYVRGINFVIAAVCVIFGALLGLVTMLDLLYLAVPPIRKWLCAESAQPQSGGMGMGGMGMGMRGGYGMGGMGGMGAAQPSSTGIGRFVSDEAVAALAEATAGAQPQGGGMGMGMGMMGGMGATAQPPKTKSVILTYAKKRAFALIAFFACIVLFTSTLFTDVGLYIGQWIVTAVSGILP